jgi:hypothetical protein
VDSRGTLAGWLGCIGTMSGAPAFVSADNGLRGRLFERGFK